MQITLTQEERIRLTLGKLPWNLSTRFYFLGDIIIGGGGTDASSIAKQYYLQFSTVVT